MGSFSKQQLVSNFTTTHMVVTLFLYLLFLDGFSCSVEGVLSSKSNNNECTTVVEGKYVGDQDYATLCRSKKYSGGICLPNYIDKKPLGVCCCLSLFEL
ncbi:hypothetical protein MKX01_019645 [Papaver californicum]|nr:hypothetical protein MKX01_019645 [Papaver californicum]